VGIFGPKFLIILEGWGGLTELGEVFGNGLLYLSGDTGGGVN